MYYIMQGCVEYTYNGTLHGKPAIEWIWGTQALSTGKVLRDVLIRKKRSLGKG